MKLYLGTINKTSNVSGMKTEVAMKYFTYYEESTEISYYKYMKFINRRYNSEDKVEGKGARKEFTVRKMKFFNPAESILTQRTDLPKYYMTIRDSSSKHVYLEKKTVQNELTYKASAKITREECDKILNKDIAWMKNHKDDVVRDFYLQLSINGIRPGYITDYRREVFRVNKKDYIIFDKQISRAAGNCVDFFDHHMIMINCLGTDRIMCTSHHSAKMPAITTNLIEQQDYDCNAILSVL